MVDVEKIEDVNEVFIRHPYTSPRVRRAILFEGPGKAKQAMKDECDINNIVNRYRQRGILDHVSRYQGHYGDFGDGVSFHQAQETLVKAQEAFDSLPAAIRTRFHNDPAEFLDFVQDEANADELIEMGLRDKPVKAAPVAQEEPVASEPPPAEPQA